MPGARPAPAPGQERESGRRIPMRWWRSRGRTPGRRAEESAAPAAFESILEVPPGGRAGEVAGLDAERPLGADPEACVFRRVEHLDAVARRVLGVLELQHQLQLVRRGDQLGLTPDTHGVVGVFARPTPARVRVWVSTL